MCPGIQRAHIYTSGSFHEDGEPSFKEVCGEAESVSVDERLSAGDFHQGASKSLDLSKNLRQREPFTPMKRIGCVAPDAPQWAAGEPNEGTG